MTNLTSLHKRPIEVMICKNQSFQLDIITYEVYRGYDHSKVGFFVDHFFFGLCLL